jgi:hypothetical protein
VKIAVNRRRRMMLAALAVFLALGVQQRFFTHNSPADQPRLGFIDGGSLEALRTDFNRAAGEVRIILLLSPT